MPTVNMRDWLTPTSREGRRWGRLICAKSAINLGESGGYAILSGFLNFDEPIKLQDGELLLIACQQVERDTDPDGQRHASDNDDFDIVRTGKPIAFQYEYALVMARGDAIVQIDDGEMVKVLDLVCRSVIGGYDMRRKCKNWLYLVAVYGYAHFHVKELRNKLDVDEDTKTFVRAYTDIVSTFREAEDSKLNNAGLRSLVSRPQRKITRGLLRPIEDSS